MRRPRASSVLAAGGAALLGLLWNVPWASDGLPSGALDDTWQMVLHDAFLRGRQAGVDSVFTFGPWGFLYAGVDPGTRAVALLAWCVLVLALVATLLRGAGARGQGPLFTFAWCAALLWLTDGTFEMLVVLLAAALFVPPAEALSTRGRAGLAALLAATPLVKFSCAAFVGPPLLYAAYQERRSGRRRAALDAAVLGFLAAWLLAGQGLANLPAYLRNSLEVAGGYSSGMSLDGPARDVLGYWLGAALLVASVAHPEGRGPTRALRGALVLLLWAVAKAAFVRHDGHAVLATQTLLILALFFFGALPVRSHALSAAALSVSLAGSVAALRTHEGYAYGPRLADLPDHTWEAVGQATLALRGDPGLRERYAARMAELRAADPLPAWTGGADVYPHDGGLVLAHGLEYRPRPVIQSYSAYTPRLAALDAAHLRGEDAPRFLAVEVSTIDDDLPLLLDAPSYLEMLGRYAPRDLDGRFVQLERRAAGVSPRLGPVRRERLPLGRATPIDAGAGVAWARLRLTPTAWGRLLTFAHRPRSLWLTLTTAEGPGDTRRLRAAPAADGFLLSPYISNAYELAQLAADPGTPSLAGRRVVSLEPRAEAGLFPPWGAEATLELQQVIVDAPPVAFAPDSRLAPLQELARRQEPSGRPLRVDAIGPAPERFVLSAHAPSRSHLRAPRCTGLTLGYGILDGAWEDGATSDGVTFVVRRQEARGAPGAPLFERTLRPLTEPADRGPQTARVACDWSDAAELVFETRAAGSDAWDWAYWSAARFEP